MLTAAHKNAIFNDMEKHLNILNVELEWKSTNAYDLRKL